MTEQNLRTGESRLAGVLLIALVVVSLAFMAHHPTLGTPGHDTLAGEAAAEAGLNGAVRGALIVVTLGFYVILSGLSAALGASRLTVRAAQTGLVTATAAMTGAALISGFIVPDTAASLIRGGAEAEFPALLRMLGAANQTLAKAGTLAYGGAFLFWSMRMVFVKGFVRIAGLAGLIAGGALAAAMLTGAVRLDVDGMTLVVAVMGAWFLLVAIAMLRGGFATAEERSQRKI